MRIGIHTGRPRISETGYIGIAVHTAARVCWAAHGGQILLSAAVRDGIDGQVDGITMRSLGRHVLAGLPEPELLFQVVASDLRTDFPAPRVATNGTQDPAAAR